MSNLRITKHAYGRAKERFRWKKSSLERMAKEALDRGVSYKTISGGLHRFLTKLYKSEENCNNILVYGEVVFFFKGTTLITLYHLPNRFKKYINK